MSSRTATPTELYVPGVSRAIMWIVLVKTRGTHDTHSGWVCLLFSVNHFICQSSKSNHSSTVTNCSIMAPRATAALVAVLMWRLGAAWAAEAPCACADLARNVGALEAAWVEQSSYIARLESRLGALENHGVEASDKPSAGVAPGRPAGRELLTSSSAPTRIGSGSVHTVNP